MPFPSKWMKNSLVDWFWGTILPFLRSIGLANQGINSLINQYPILLGWLWLLNYIPGNLSTKLPCHPTRQARCPLATRASANQSLGASQCQNIYRKNTIYSGKLFQFHQILQRLECLELLKSIFPMKWVTVRSYYIKTKSFPTMWNKG